MRLALFDLDETLIGGDSDLLWIEFLVEEGLLPPGHVATSHRYYNEYAQGRLDIDEFMSFQLEPLVLYPLAELKRWRDGYMRRKIQPSFLPAAGRLLGHHRARGHRLVIITSSNRFTTEPIAKALQVDELLATELEMSEGRYTGRYSGEPLLGEAKLRRLKQWREEKNLQVEESWFYSDSRNDIPLLEHVDHAVAVDPDEVLRKHAGLKGWPIISLR